jgi:hypothetical protein
MQLNVGKEVAAMQEMPVSQLRDRYAEVFGETTSRLTTSLRAAFAGCQRARTTFRVGHPDRPLFRGFCAIGARKSESSSTSVVYRELRFLAWKEPVNWLIQKAESQCSRLFALNAGFSGVYDDSGRRARVLVPNGLLSLFREQPWRLGSHPGSNPFELSC